MVGLSTTSLLAFAIVQIHGVFLSTLRLAWTVRQLRLPGYSFFGSMNRLVRGRIAIFNKHGLHLGVLILFLRQHNVSPLISGLCTTV